MLYINLINFYLLYLFIWLIFIINLFEYCIGCFVRKILYFMFIFFLMNISKYVVILLVLSLNLI